MGLLDDDYVTQFDIWSALSVFIKKKIIEKWSHYYWPVDIENFKYRIYPPCNENYKGLYVYFYVDKDRKEVEIYIIKKNHYNPNKKLKPLTYYDEHYTSNEMSCKKLIELYHESAG